MYAIYLVDGRPHRARGDEWDPAKDGANRKKHGISFDEAKELFESGVEYLEFYDADHSEIEDRFIALGPIRRGAVLVAWTSGSRTRYDSSARDGPQRLKSRSIRSIWGCPMSDDIPALTKKDFERAIPSRVRKRLMRGQIESGADIAALRRFVGLTQSEFARAMGISVHTLRNWEQSRRHPHGSALALLRIAARHPRIIRENLESAA